MPKRFSGRSHYGPPIVANIWPETLQLLDEQAGRSDSSRAAIARLAIKKYRDCSLDTYGSDISALPDRGMIQARYDTPLNFGPVFRLPQLSIPVERTADTLMWIRELVESKLAVSTSDVLRRVVAYEIPVLAAVDILDTFPNR